VEWLARGIVDGARVRALALVALCVSSLAMADEASDLVVNNCLCCHDEQLLAQQRLTPKQWAAVVKKMQGWGAPVEPENVEALVKYLSATYSMTTPRYVPVPIDVASAGAEFVALPDGIFKGGNADKGRALYQTACQSCHGEDGHGTAKGMNLVDRPLLWRANEFAATTRAGRGRMPSFGTLQNGDIAALLAYLRSR
jgi:cytochrome c2